MSERESTFDNTVPFDDSQDDEKCSTIPQWEGYWRIQLRKNASRAFSFHISARASEMTMPFASQNENTKSGHTITDHSQIPFNTNFSQEGSTDSGAVVLTAEIYT